MCQNITILLLKYAYLFDFPNHLTPLIIFFLAEHIFLKGRKKANRFQPKLLPFASYLSPYLKNFRDQSCIDIIDCT